VFEVLKNQYPHIQASYMCGLSLGEYSALAAARAISFEEGLMLVRKRGELMDEAGRQNKGTMASIIGLDVEMCRAVCRESGAELANLNAPDQTVLSGAPEAVHKAMQIAKDKGAKRAIELKVSGAFHSSLMKPAQKGLENALNSVTISTPQTKVICNVTADVVSDPSEIKSNLALQVTSPVCWVEIMKRLQNEGII
jgi:[acyl-carrier-protein] S-malonyltransferase